MRYCTSLSSVLPKVGVALIGLRYLTFSMADEDPKKPQESEPDELDLRALELLMRSEEPRTDLPSPEVDDDFEQRLAQIEAKAGEARQKREVQKRMEREREGRDVSTTRGLGIGLSIAYTIIGLPMIGLAIGWYLDNRYNANAWKPILVMAGATIAIVFAVVQLNRSESGK